jgi:amino acid transporter
MSAAVPDSPELVRGIGRPAMVAVMINAIVGAGILGLPAKVHALVGPLGLVAFLACGIVIAVIGFCFAEVASRFVQTGGPYMYVRHALGPVAGFVIGWLMWVTRVAALAAIANVMLNYLAGFVPGADAGTVRIVVLALVIGGLAMVLLSGVRESARAATVFTIGKLLPLLLFIVVGLFFLDAERFRLPAFEASPFAQAVLLLVFAFSGFEGAVVLAGESKDPRRDMPAAVMISLAVVTALYVLIQTVCIGTLPTLATSTRPLAEASERFMGPAGAMVVTLGALISTTGTMFSTVFLGSRVLFAMAEQRQLPAVLGSVNARFRTPHVAIVLSAVLGFGLAISGTFTYLAGLSVLTRLLIYIGTAFALIALRRREAETQALVRIPGGVILAIAAILASIALLANSQARELRDTAIAIAVGLVLYATVRLRGRGDRATSAPASDLRVGRR